MLERITRIPGLCNGKPTIRGYRITVRTVLEWLAAGESEAAILAAYPFLEREDLLACLAYAALAVDRPSYSFIQPGEYQPGEKPGDFAGIWKDPERDLDALRKAAWDRPWHDEAEEEV